MKDIPNLSEVTILQPAEVLSQIPLDVYAAKVSAGFPSPSNDYLEGKLDLNEHLIKNPPATFFVSVSGDSMIGAGIHPEDILVVDRSISPTSGKIVIAVVDGDLTVKRLLLGGGGNNVFLMAENPSYPPITITEEMSFQVWGVVTYVIHKP
jgi:DNA polymerase V